MRQIRKRRKKSAQTVLDLWKKPVKWFKADRFRLLYCLVLVIFVILTIILGLHHEPWADESQAWLIARDSSVAELFTSTLHFDGHPALWHLVLKFFQTIGLPFEYLFVIPIIFSTIGVAIFLFKSKFPWYLKIMFPFTFVILYQFTIVARGYCLLLPLLAWLACIWDKRYEKVGQFTLVLTLLINAEVYSLLFAAGVFLYYFYGAFVQRQKMAKKERRKILVSFLILTLCFIGTAFYAFPAPTYEVNNTTGGFEWYFISDSFMVPFYADNNFKIILSLVIFVWILVAYLKSNQPRNFWQFLLFLTPMIVFMMVKYFSEWHLLIVTLIAIFCFWIHGLEKSKWIISLLGITFLVQIYWSIWSCVYDYENVYSPGREVAEFLQDYQDKKIYGRGFDLNTINAYYDYNIFENWSDKGYFNWDSRSKYFQTKLTEQEMLANDYDVVVVAVGNRNEDDEKLSDKYEQYEQYEQYEFTGLLFFEDTACMDDSIKVYVRKEN